jgi:hypothetical protein
VLAGTRKMFGVRDINENIQILCENSDEENQARNDCIAWLGSMLGSWVQVPARVDLRRTDYIQWGQA